SRPLSFGDSMTCFFLLLNKTPKRRRAAVSRAPSALGYPECALAGLTGPPEHILRDHPLRPRQSAKSLRAFNACLGLFPSTALLPARPPDSPQSPRCRLPRGNLQL